MPNLTTKVYDANSSESEFVGLVNNFFKYTFSPKDIELIKDLGIGVYLETACIDERSNAQTIKMGQIRLEDNAPGGGFDFYTDEKIAEMLKISGGNIVLDFHKGCGWGGIKIKEELEKNFKEVHTIIEKAFVDEDFRNAVVKSHKLSAVLRFEKDYDAMKESILSIKSAEDLNAHPYKELLDLAFVYGKAIELKQKFLNVAENIKLEKVHISINSDLLVDMPHHHIAKEAIINLTERVFYSRIPRNDKFESFYADLKISELQPVLTLIATIMAGDHSETKSLPHSFFIFVDQSNLDIVSEILNAASENLNSINSDKTIVIFPIQDEEKNKTKEEIQETVR